MLEILTRNGIFTWNNRRKDFSYIAEKLDRFFFKGDLTKMDLTIIASIQPIAGSDHYPVRIEFIEPKKLSTNPFKCEKMWFLDNNFMECIKQW